MLHYVPTNFFLKIINSECVGGTHSCFVNFTVNTSSDHLSVEQLETLKSQIIQVFDFQLNNSNVAERKVQEALKTPPSGKQELVKAYNTITKKLYMKVQKVYLLQQS